MVMWNLVGHGIKWAARGIDSFSRTEAGKKTAEVSARAFQAAKEASKEMVDSYKSSKAPNGRSLPNSNAGNKWESGNTVVTHDGRLGVTVRYLQVNEIGGSSSDLSLTDLVLMDLLQHTNELDRYLIIRENSIRRV